MKEQIKNIGEVTEDVSPKYCEGLKRMISSLYGHTSTNVLSVAIAKKLSANGSRFQYSHEFMNISLPHILQWMKGEENLDLKLRKVKNSDDKYEHVQDMFINNIIYRPQELEYLACYDLISQYELRIFPKQKLKQTATLWRAKHHLIFFKSILLTNQKEKIYVFHILTTHTSFQIQQTFI